MPEEAALGGIEQDVAVPSRHCRERSAAAVAVDLHHPRRVEAYAAEEEAAQLAQPAEAVVKLGATQHGLGEAEDA